jgi:NADPH:quinone reductase-like Zn-dependent oxidoreductase
LILVGLLNGRESQVDLARILSKRLEIRGTTLRARPLSEKIEVASRFSKHVVPLFQSGLLRPVVDRSIPLAQAAEAHLHLEDNANFGKVVLQID